MKRRTEGNQETEDESFVERDREFRSSPFQQASLSFVVTWIGLIIGTIIGMYTLGWLIKAVEAIAYSFICLLGVAAAVAIYLLIRKEPWKALGILIAVASPFLIAVFCQLTTG